jgi:hypothetical protein
MGYQLNGKRHGAGLNLLLFFEAMIFFIKFGNKPLRFFTPMIVPRNPRNIIWRHVQFLHNLIEPGEYRIFPMPQPPNLEPPPRSMLILEEITFKANPIFAVTFPAWSAPEAIRSEAFIFIRAVPPGADPATALPAIPRK